MRRRHLEDVVALLVGVSGLKSRTGTLRVQLYGANPADFLAKGKKLRRIDVPVTATAMDVCIALPQPGRYAVAVRHDADAVHDPDTDHLQRGHARHSP